MRGPLAYWAPMGARLRAGAALSAGAFALHQLRYLAGHEATAGEGHGYLALAGPLVALLCAIAFAQLAVAWQHQLEPGRRLPLQRLWFAAVAALLAVYFCQESLEGLLTPGRDAVGALAADGGWVVLPLAVGLGLVVALLLRGAEALLAARASGGSGFAPPRDAKPPHATPHLRFGPGLARHLASRAPPQAL